MKENKDNSCTGAWQRLHRNSVDAVKKQLLTPPNVYMTTAGCVFGGCLITLVNRATNPTPTSCDVYSVMGEATVRSGYTLLTAAALTYMSNMCKKSSRELPEDASEIKIRIR